MSLSAFVIPFYFGSGSISGFGFAEAKSSGKLVFKTLCPYAAVSAMTLALTDAPLIQMESPTVILSLEAVTLFAQQRSLETGALLTCLSLRASSLSFVIKKYSWLHTLIKRKIKLSHI